MLSCLWMELRWRVPYVALLVYQYPLEWSKNVKNYNFHDPTPTATPPSIAFLAPTAGLLSTSTPGDATIRPEYMEILIIWIAHCWERRCFQSSNDSDFSYNPGFRIKFQVEVPVTRYRSVTSVTKSVTSVTRYRFRYRCYRFRYRCYRSVTCYRKFNLKFDAEI